MVIYKTKRFLTLTLSGFGIMNDVILIIQYWINSRLFLVLKVAK